MKKAFAAFCVMLCIIFTASCGMSAVQDITFEDVGCEVSEDIVSYRASQGVYIMLTNDTSEPTAFRLGDVNEDGDITNKDILAVFRNIYSSELYPLGVISYGSEGRSYKIGDANKDGDITNKDILMLFRYIYSPDLYPLDPPVEECKHTETETVLGFDATCTEPGLTDGVKCVACKEIIVAQTEIAPKGHKEVHHAAKAPTSTDIGWNEYVTCEDCDYTTYEELPAKSEWMGPGIWM